MRSKAVLLTVTVLAVTLLGACGENKGKKKSFRPRGVSKIVPAQTADGCAEVNKGGRGTIAQNCANWVTIAQGLTAQNEHCRDGIISRMELNKCEGIEDVRKGSENRTIGVNTDTHPARTETIVTPNPNTPATPEGIAADPEAKVVATVLDPETGNETVEPAVPLATANIPTENIAPVTPAAPATPTPAPAAAAPAAEAPASTSIPSATAGTTEPVLTGIPSTCSATQITAAKADTTSCGKFERINTKAIRFASALDFRSDVNRTPSRWSAFVCVQSEHTAAKFVLDEIRKEIPAATDTTKCSSELTTVTIACALAIKCGGQKDIMSLPRLTTDPNGPDSDEEVSAPAAPAAAN